MSLRRWPTKEEVSAIRAGWTHQQLRRTFGGANGYWVKLRSDCRTGALNGSALSSAAATPPAAATTVADVAPYFGFRSLAVNVAASSTVDVLAAPVAEPPLFAPLIELFDVDVLVAGDWHVPYHSETLVAKLLTYALDMGIKTLVINGDFLDSAVFFRGGQDHRPTMTEFRSELHAAEQMLRALLQRFQMIYWIAGNHEQRLFRLTKGELDMELLRRMVAEGVGDRVVVTDRDHIVIHYTDTPERITWRITHGESGSTVIATNAAVLKADSYSCNVLQGHNHLFGMRQTRSGKHIGVDHGAMCNPALIEYKQLRTTTYPTWVPGFAALKRGKVALYSPRFTHEFTAGAGV